MRAINDVAAVTGENPGDLVVLVPNLFPPHQLRAVAPVVIEPAEDVRGGVAERYVGLIPARVERRPVRHGVEGEPLADVLIATGRSCIDGAFRRQWHGARRRVCTVADIVLEHHEMEESIVNKCAAIASPVQIRPKVREAPACRDFAETGNLVGAALLRLDLRRFGLESLIVVEILERGTVRQVCTGLADRAHLRAAGAAELGVVVRGEYLKFSYRLDTDRCAEIVVFG